MRKKKRTGKLAMTLAKNGELREKVQSLLIQIEQMTSAEKKSDGVLINAQNSARMSAAKVIDLRNELTCAKRIIAQFTEWVARDGIECS